MRPTCAAAATMHCRFTACSLAWLLIACVSAWSPACGATPHHDSRIQDSITVLCDRNAVPGAAVTAGLLAPPFIFCSLCATCACHTQSCRQSNRPPSQSGPHVRRRQSPLTASCRRCVWPCRGHSRSSRCQSSAQTHSLRFDVISGAWAVTILVLLQVMAQWFFLYESRTQA